MEGHQETEVALVSVWDTCSCSNSATTSCKPLTSFFPLSSCHLGVVSLLENHRLCVTFSAFRQGGAAQCYCCRATCISVLNDTKTRWLTHQSISTSNKGINKHCSVVLHLVAWQMHRLLSVNLYSVRLLRFYCILCYSAGPVVSGYIWPLQRKKSEVSFNQSFCILITSSAMHPSNIRFPLFISINSHCALLRVCPTDTLTPEWRGCRVAAKRLEWSDLSLC